MKSAAFVNPIIAASPKRATLRPFTASTAASSLSDASNPGKKKFSHFLDAPDAATTSSGFKSRSELLAKRKHERLHFFDRYDLDGDGVVDPFEVRLASLVDLNNDGEISQDERDYLKDLIDSGKLKHMTFLQDKRGGEAKKHMTWIGTKEWRRVEREKEIARQERRDRMKAAAALPSTLDIAADDTGLLEGLAKRLNPTRDLEKLLRPLVHRGHTPMQRVLSGRHTPSMEYKSTPRWKSREEMLAARRAKMSVHKSFDLDGDGQIDPLEHLIASLLDVNQDGELSEDEKVHAKDLIARLKQYYVTGLDRAGPAAAKNGIRIVQRDGVVMDGMVEASQPDDIGEMIKAHAAPPPASPSLWSPAPSSRRGLTPGASARATNSTIWSPPPRSSVLSRAGSVASTRSLADDLRDKRSRPVRPPDTPLIDPSGAEVLRVDSARSRHSHMSSLVGV